MSPKRLNLPDTASLARHGQGAKLNAPSAERNGAAIVNAVTPYLPVTGKALEIASGTGQHIVRLAAVQAGLIWQPTDIDTDRIASITAWVKEAGLPNIIPPRVLDATLAGWGEGAAYDVVFLSNLLHLISGGEARTVITETATALTAGGVSLSYGPFRRGEGFASDSDRRFNESLISQDPEIGYKSVEQVQEWQRAAGLIPEDPLRMPANNLILVARKP